MAAISTWRRSEDVRNTSALIGPNAILQLLPVLDHALGVEGRARLLRRAGIADPPDGSCMIPEQEAARLHTQVRRDMPDRAPELAARAGQATADYILAHRIPTPAQTLLRALPAPLAARLLSRAIARHAWTFAGSGVFSVIDPWCFDIRDNPLVRADAQPHNANTTPAHPLCHWHAAVFTRLYCQLVDPSALCRETRCCALGDTACRFEITRPARHETLPP